MKRLALGLLLGGASLHSASAQSVVNVNTPPPLTTVGGGGVLYEYNLGGGLLVQMLDGAGNAVTAANPFPVQVEAGGGGSTTANQGTAGTSPWLFNLGQVDGVNLGPPTAWGTPPSGVVPGVNANILAMPNVTIAALPLPPGAATAANQAPPTYAGISASIATPIQGVTVGVPVTISPPVAVSTPLGGTVTTGGTYQQVLSQIASRKGCAIQNQSSGTEFIYLGSTANANTAGTSSGASGVIQISPLAFFYCGSTGNIADDAVQITSATTGAAYAGDSQ